ncbi:unnamed protein product [Prorocentrum cordatum]|uniref:Uncharacterized protein n=1 Tax=Prorocentrum cordatum TaxID=2364126 RepID=A0ABN9TSN0_9DINO|nr:unnamed protein product [Polarella glacialis]
MTPMQGSVRDPDAVVMSRITKVKAELSRGDKKRSTSRGEGGAQEETLEEFVSTNKLCKRIEEELLKLTKAQQGTVMGTDGGRNGFVLLGVVRDPDAVVLSRINRVKADAAGGTRAAAAAPARRDQRRGRSRSYSDYYDDYSYTPSPEAPEGSTRRRRGRRSRGKRRRSTGMARRGGGGRGSAAAGAAPMPTLAIRSGRCPGSGAPRSPWAPAAACTDRGAPGGRCARWRRASRAGGRPPAGGQTAHRQPPAR